MTGFSVTFDVVTPESAEQSEYAESGVVVQDVSLRAALEEIEEYSYLYVEANEYPVRSPRWINFGGIVCGQDWDEEKTLALHIPEQVTSSSRKRIARLVHCYGV